MDGVSEVHISESIASIEASLKAKSDGSPFHMPFTPGQLDLISDMAGRRVAKAGVDFSIGAVAHLLDAVRNLVLEWAIDLERSGVTGAGISFSSDEKRLRKPALPTFISRKSITLPAISALATRRAI